MIIDPPQVVAGLVARWRQRPVDGQYLEPVTCQVQLADDLGPQQADDVRRDAELEARDRLLGDRCASQDVASLEDDDLSPARAR